MCIRDRKKTILNHHDPKTLVDVISNHSVSFDSSQIKKLFNKAFSLRLKKIKKGFAKMQVDFHEEKLKTLYRPNIAVPSSIIKDETFETIWEWIPDIHKISDPISLFSTSKDGFNLMTLYRRCESHKGAAMLILIKASNGSVFGVYSNEVFDTNYLGSELYHGSNDTFVFTLQPREAKFEASEVNYNHMYMCMSYFSFGAGGDGPAMTLDADLNLGSTYKCVTYNNELLTGVGDPKNNSFNCVTLEVYILE
eukprot:TRINITY_DN1877_c0_g1_i1.p1 TRINITY_DN1877_c0_g1~~TRINITY_DN1877_c0_g1_i1.p1  ORF type:complete len:267 (-),score=62.63 TRINITY_DN1877_c0_g1_i1:384-1136(-)